MAPRRAMRVLAAAAAVLAAWCGYDPRVSVGDNVLTAALDLALFPVGGVCCGGRTDAASIARMRWVMRAAARAGMVLSPDMAHVAVSHATVPRRGGGGIPVVLYRPAAGGPCGAGPLPLVVFFHGGATVFGAADEAASAPWYARRACAVVASVEYRLAPEHPFPAGVDDCSAALLHFLRDPAAAGAGPSARVGVAGESAGAMMAAVAARRARDDGLPLAAQYLAVPVVRYGAQHPSSVENRRARVIDPAAALWGWNRYAPPAACAADGRCQPAAGGAALRGVAPAVVVTAAADALRDDGREYAAALQGAGALAAHVEVAASHVGAIVPQAFGLRVWPDEVAGAFDIFAAALRPT